MKKNDNRKALGDIGNIVDAAETENQRQKKSITVVNSPVRRQFSATLAKNQQLPQVTPVAEEGEEEHMQRGDKQRKTMPSETEKPKIKSDVENSTESMEDCKALDSVTGPSRIISLSQAALLKNDEKAPMLVHSAVDDKEDIDESPETETEEAEDLFPNIDEDPVPNISPVPNIDEEPEPDINIDEGDEGNPLLVAEYIEDLSRLYRETEGLTCVPPDYMSYQTDINHSMRAVVVDWIIEVHNKFDLMPETLFLAVNLMDRYLSSQRGLRRSRLQLVGITAMFVASKYEEINAPYIEDFLNISNYIYIENDVLQMESSMLRALQFNIIVSTPYVFLNRFLKAAQADKDLEMMSFFLVELCLVQYVMLRYRPSMLAAAAVYIGQHTLKRLPPWNRTMKHYTAYTEDQLQECAKLMSGFHHNSWKGNLIAAHKKYSREEFNRVAHLAPARFL